MSARVSFSSKTEALLDDAVVVWLTTVRPSGQPQASPVWFVIDDGDFLVYSLDDTARVGNIRGNPLVALNLDSNEGGDVVTIEGRAQIVSGPSAHDHAEYREKYRARMKAMGYEPEAFASDYPVPIRITPTRIREH